MRLFVNVCLRVCVCVLLLRACVHFCCALLLRVCSFVNLYECLLMCLFACLLACACVFDCFVCVFV